MREDAPGVPASDHATRSRRGTESSYGIPPDAAGTLPWSFVEETLATDRNYWVPTVKPVGRPHARPTWGVWIDGRFHCGRGEWTRWVRNPSTNPAIVVHTESAESVIVVEGDAERVDEESATADRIRRIDDTYEEKYGIRHGTPLFAVHPHRVLAWRDFPTDSTRWRFDR